MQQHELLRVLDELRSQPHESATVEFKSNESDEDRIAKLVSALGNSAALHQAERARLVWGVDDTTHAVKGTQFDPWVQKVGNQSLTFWLTQSITPPPDLEFHRADHPQGPVVLLEIRPPRTAPFAFKGTRYIRMDSSTTELSKHSDREQRLWSLLGKSMEDWSAELVPEATHDDLDPEALKEVRRRLSGYLAAQRGGSGREDEMYREDAGYDVGTLLGKALLRRLGLVEGKGSNLFVSSSVSQLTAQKATYIHNRGLDDEYYRTLVLEYLRTFGRAAPRELDDLLMPKLPDVLDSQQKTYKVRNLIQTMRRDGLVERSGPKMHPFWTLPINRSPE